MKESICGANCAECPSKEVCPGCAETKGCPFGKQCYVAKYILTGGMENWLAFKKGLMAEINGLNIDGMEKLRSCTRWWAALSIWSTPFPAARLSF